MAGQPNFNYKAHPALDWQSGEVKFRIYVNHLASRFTIVGQSASVSPRNEIAFDDRRG